MDIPMYSITTLLALLRNLVRTGVLASRRLFEDTKSVNIFVQDPHI